MFTGKSFSDGMARTGEVLGQDTGEREGRSADRVNKNVPWIPPRFNRLLVA